MSPDSSTPGTFTCTVHLNPGYHQFKFIVDQEWRHDPGMPAMPDPIGNVNNWLFVRKPEDDLGQSQVAEPAAPPTSIPATAPATVEDPRVTRTKIRDFLATHTSAELIPESGKVVLLDMDLPLRQALHALHDQVCVLSGAGLSVLMLTLCLGTGCAWQATVFAPLFDTKEGAVRGVICASDFIATLQQLSSSNPLSEAEMDQHTIRGLLGYDSAPVEMDYVEPEDSLQHVVNLLLNNSRSMVPIVIVQDGKIQEVLHNATLGGTLG